MQMETVNYRHQSFDCDECSRSSQPLCNDRCQTILYKAVFEHFKEIRDVAALLLASKSFQNSSFGANFLVNFIFDDEIVAVFNTLLSPSSCFSLQLAPSLHFKNSEQISRGISTFVAELAKTKYLPLQLQSLSFERASNVQLASLFARPIPLSRLQSLILDACEELDDDTVTLICKSAVHLSTLKFSDCSIITDSSLQEIATLAGLNSLCLEHCSSITDAGLAHIAKIAETITSLSLAFCPQVLTDVGMEHISKLSQITQLNLSGSGMTDNGLAQIATLSKIVNLNLACFKNITDSGFEHLSKLKQIEVLDVSWSPITDVGLKYISRLASLTSIRVNDCDAIADEGLCHLSKLTDLTYLNISWAFGITAGAKTMFMDALPNCVYVDYGG